MNLLLDMNLSPAWQPLLEGHGWQTRHWRDVGAPDATDVEIMAWAKAQGYCVVTNDLDFSAILAATRASGPSVVQIRGQDISPATLGETLVAVLNGAQNSLRRGAILTLDVHSSRVRTLPL
jgi:predicted nuclease of predicted toxin-antitoxin system